MFDFFKRSKKDPKNQLRKLVGKFELEPFPSSVMKTIVLLRDPDSSMADIAAQIQMDPGMNVKILRTVNAAGFGLLNKVSNLQHAATLLGRARLESMVLSCAVADNLPPVVIPCLNQKQFWGTAAKRACLARNLSRHIHAATQAESFTAALLQDIGVAVIAKLQTEKYCPLIEDWHADGSADIITLEKNRFSYDHPTIGALVAEAWDLPEYLVNAIAGHHDLSPDSPADPAVRMVSMINYDDSQDIESQLRDICNGTCGLNDELMGEIVERALEEAAAFSEVFE